MKIGELIKAWRKAENLNIREGAKRLGICNHSTLSRIENGQQMNQENMYKLINMLFEV